MVLIREVALQFMLGVSRDTYPREFAGLIRMEEDEIKEVLVLPATLYGEGFAQISRMHVPWDKSIVGSVHSHPTENFKPSKQDIIHFGKTGSIHLIIRYPYRGLEDIACYNRVGDRLALEVRLEDE